MAQVAKGSISIAGSQIVGGTEIDPGTVRGEGSPTDPRLLVPIAIAMNSRKFLVAHEHKVTSEYEGEERLVVGKYV